MYTIDGDNNLMFGSTTGVDTNDNDSKTLIVHVAIPSGSTDTVIKDIVHHQRDLIMNAVGKRYQSVVALPSYSSSRTEFEVI